MNVEIDLSNVVLKTERLILRPWTMDDLEDFFEYAKVDGVGQRAGWMPHKNIEESRTILQMFIDEKKTFAIEFNGKAIGSLGVEKYSEEALPELTDLRCREIGYVLSKDYWGKGIMPEAVKCVNEFLFNELNLDCIVCAHFIENIQSMRVQEKCGFVHYKKSIYETHMGEKKESWYSLLQKK